MIRTAAMVLMLASVSGCAAVPFPAVPARAEFVDPHEVPLRLLGNVPFVQVRLDGGPPAWFVLDTGASHLFLHRAFAEARGITLDFHDTTPVRTLTLGGATFHDLAASTLDLSDLARTLGPTFGGVLGLSVFREITITLDYPRQRLIATRRPLSADQPDTFPFRSIDGVPWIPVTIGGARHELLLDSGATEFLVLPLGSEDAFPFTARPVPGFSAATADGLKPSFLARLAGTIEVGSLKVENPRITLLTDKRILGGSFLRHFAVTFDQERGLVRLDRKGGTGPIASPPLRTSGITFIPRGSRWVVHEVLRESRAAARDVQRGDQILSVDGRSTAALPPAAWARMLRTRDEITLVLRRGDVTREVVLPIEIRVP